ncbi:MAG: L,D-transpeptidase family protein [Rhodobacteraceae bacterium]|nr:L,D-transpeptidase family protein [Paracoccaceae bacterium]
MGRVFPCTLGRRGVTDAKCEGDGATPRGVHGVIGLLYRPDRVARGALPGWARPMGLWDIWSDDPRDPDYNLYLQGPDHPFRHERLRRADPLYDVVLLSDWNWPRAVRGAGSAIFVHGWRAPGHPTAGCIGLPPPALRWIAGRLRHRSRLIVR